MLKLMTKPSLSFCQRCKDFGNSTQSLTGIGKSLKSFLPKILIYTMKSLKLICIISVKFVENLQNLNPKIVCPIIAKELQDFMKEQALV